MLRLAVSALLADARIAQVRVAVTPGDGWVDDALTGLPRTCGGACGGATRADTVAGALADSARPTMPGCWCMTRPGLVCRPRALARLIDACLKDPVGGGWPCRWRTRSRAATSASSARWTATACGWPRRRRCSAPARLRDALTAAAVAGVAVTDEASAIEAAGYAPRLVPGSLRNFKVTWPDDFELMEKWL